MFLYVKQFTILTAWAQHVSTTQNHENSHWKSAEISASSEIDFFEICDTPHSRNKYACLCQRESNLDTLTMKYNNISIKKIRIRGIVTAKNLSNFKTN